VDEAGAASGAHGGNQDFLKLRKDADSGIPILQHAKAEFTNLQ
jgi:hypothetical protein